MHHRTISSLSHTLRRLLQLGRRAAGPALACALLASALAPPATATQVKIFQHGTASDFLAGELEGVSVDQLGRLRLAGRIERLTSLEEPFLLSAERLGDGWVVGTGNDGRVLEVSADGAVRELFQAPEPEVFAVWADDDGTVFAGTSPEGKVYRIAGGSGEVFFDPQEIYIWDLARAADGRLLVATGTQGKLFSVGADGQGKVLYKSHDTHLRTLQPLSGKDTSGDVLVGTAGEGLILRVTPQGTAHTLFDAAQPEVVALTAGADGTTYAVAVASEASQVDLTQASEGQKESSGDGEADSEEGVSAVVDDGGFDGIGSRPSGFGGGRSELLSISAEGLVQTLGSFQDETVYSLLWHNDRLWVGTGQEGKLYSWRQRDRVLVLEKETEDRQIVAVLPGAEGPSLATTNAAAVYRSRSGTEQQGTFISKVLDAEQLARFGTFHWWGNLPEGTAARFSFRSGVSAVPDATWSEWSEAGSGRELSLESVPSGRYVQWRAELTSGNGVTPRIDSAELSYRQQNLSPRIQKLTVLDPGQILMPANFNPAQQVFEPAHPNRDGIFTTLDPRGERSNGRLKSLWKLGYRALRWEAQDPNGDDLTYRLEFRPAGPAGQEAGPWLPVAEDLEDEHYNFDATVLPDGVYRFRLVASDAKANGDGEALTAETLSGPVIVDHGTPEVLSRRSRGKTLEVVVGDSWNPLREAVMSIDAGEWVAVPSADGLIDGRRETLILEPPAETRLLLLRLVDAAHNVLTIDLTEELP